MTVEYFSVEFAFLSHQLLYGCVFFIKQLSKGLGGSNVHDYLFEMSRVFAFEEGYLLLERGDLKSKFFILFPLIASIFTVLLVDLMISLFNDSFGFDHMLVHFLLQILILLAILMFFVQDSLGMEEILGQFFTFSGKFFDDISQLLISELKLIDFISKNNFLLLVVIPIDSRHLSILL